MDIEQMQRIARTRSKPLDEAGYLQGWRQHAGPQAEPLNMALAGGAYADRLAWVFVAGYQAALHAVFPSLAADSWACFAVTEDRSGEFPGVGWQPADDDAGKLKISGHKSWIAASRHVQQLVVKSAEVNNEPDGALATRYVLLMRNDPGVSLSSRHAPGFLPDLSQGFLSLDCAVDVDRVLGDERVRQFRWREPLYIYVAFLAWRLAEGDNLLDEMASALAQATKLAAGEHLDKVLWQGFRQQVQQLKNAVTDSGPEWQRDQRLIDMYSA